MKIITVYFLISFLFINVYGNHLPCTNISNSLENSHHSKLVIDNNDNLNVVWIEGSNKIYYRQYYDSSFTPIIQIHECDTLSSIQELTASLEGDSACVFWIEQKDSISIISACKLYSNSISTVDTLYQTNNIISRLESNKGKGLAWFERASNYSGRVGLNLITLLNEKFFFIDSCSMDNDFSITSDSTDRLNIFWLNDWIFKYKTLMDTTTWSPIKMIYINGLSGKDMMCNFNSITHKYNIAITGDLVTGWYSNGLVYIESQDTTWLPHEEIMPPGYSSPFQEFDISKYPEILIHSNGKCSVFFQNTFHGQSSTTYNVYLAEKNNFGDWIVQTYLFQGSVFLNSAAIDSKDSLYCTFKKGNDIYVGGNQIIAKIDNSKMSQEIRNLHLYQNYPNPFNPNTIIKYYISHTSKIEINLYNTLGQKINTLFKGIKNTGEHTLKLTSNNLASGIYYYELKNKNFRQLKKCILIR